MNCLLFNGPKSFLRVCPLTFSRRLRPLTPSLGIRTVFRAGRIPSTLSVEEVAAKTLNLSQSPRSAVRIVSSLNPKTLKSSDFIDISGRRDPYINFDSGGSCELNYGRYTNNIPFPDDSRGFLYYYRPKNLPSSCAQLRFRLTSNDSPKSFKSGTDLIGIDALPWSISFLELSFARSEPIQKLLRKDYDPHIVPLESMEQMRIKYNVQRTTGRDMYYLEQPFLWDMTCQLATFRLITNFETRRLNLTNLFIDCRDRTIGIPYRGLVLLRFEKSAHLGPDSNAVVIRVVKIINPITLANHTSSSSSDIYVPMPETEKLLLHRKNGQIVVRSWDMNNDSSLVGSALRILPSIHN